ncbi:methionyl-tRNA formyltransferase Fmt [Thermoclostridium stercorarium subsp. stercorarium DSM 8532]|jgi:methionyl-tRNA formyltransferase|uniref:Methionyl-tRNA formyltransferase n=3 Tax=Thermoclostridium stercorarium TaxID=1510 RepID=L7VJQ0_THES1|nr:methionyl-tRNA formyltransferase [Thermoclostridium stercorarium]AGC68340.1 methionyl-tRNA formyltransferase Fmt [Thermoclostridium stercorarium subsp. stercorarium DSM 8532]AGI39364.1 methionyl-tRNA formyltransferase [Thermoclostridium stercorarium subsp. stercorarium DSM 8532]ANW98683.1 methionyl-tRNA formyltransferase [Thermoclostridium stercorarium subsp. thermolacticum DSM 2910]ANX01224.1 methionyl-tRNA formyltransferase [Thermoclostridium stercorarium subsp. leptospartum DSM 9219]
MRIVFMGTPEFAVPSLEILINNGMDVVAVVTQPDKPRGRGYKVSFSPVKECALKYNIPVMQPEKIGSSDSVQQLKEMAPDLFVTCAFGQFLTQKVLDIPKYGTVNVHGSLLPKYRGAAPIQWAIINGEKTTGVTTMLTVLKMDAGDILLSREIPIDDDMTAGQLHDKMSIIGAELLLETIRRIEKGTITPIPQNEAEATYAPRIVRETGRINWDADATAIHNLVRGTDPWPGAYSYLNGKRMRIWKTKVRDAGLISGNKPGTIIEVGKSFITVQAGKGAVNVLEIQCDNGKRMTVEQYLCGHEIKPGDRFEQEQPL